MLAPGSKGTCVADVIVIGNAVCGEVWALSVKRGAWAGPAERLAMWEEWNGRDVMALLVFVEVAVEPDRALRVNNHKHTIVWFREVLEGGELGEVTRRPPWE